MGDLNQNIQIKKLMKQSTAQIQEELDHLEDEFTNLVSYKEEEIEVGEWIDGRSIYRRVLTFAQNVTAYQNNWTNLQFGGVGGIISQILNATISNAGASGIGCSNALYIKVETGIIKAFNNGNNPITIPAGTNLILEYVKPPT